MQPLPKKISLTRELANAALGALASGIATFTSTVTFVTHNNVKSIEDAGLSAGLIALAFFGNSLKNWLNQS